MKTNIAFAVMLVSLLGNSSFVLAQTSSDSTLHKDNQSSQAKSAGSTTMSGAKNEEPAREPHFKFNNYNMSVKVNPDGTSEALIEMKTTVLKEDALKMIKTFTLDFSTSAEKAEIVEAYTQKVNGNRVDVPKNNYQTHVDEGRNGAPPAFSDHSSITLIFPDLAVGDSAVLVYKFIETKPLFLNTYSKMANFNKFAIWDNVKVRFDLPKSMNIQFENNQMTESLNKEEKDRVIREWTFQNKEIDKTKYSDGAVYDYTRIPHIALSTFPTYQAIAKAYGEVARPKAQVTDQIRKLANEITNGETTPRDKVKSLYEWVAKNITYAGNCIAVGAVVPRDLDFVLQNKMGDCKDHATLLQALLAAKGIESSQALLNADKTYTLPKLPIVSVVNHVINYIPSLDLFLDATATDIPFGVLPPQDASKNVLLVDGYKEGMRTPSVIKGFTDHKSDTTLRISEDGSAEGLTNITLHGYEAIKAKLAFEKLEKIDQHKWLESMIRRSNLEGSAELVNGTYDEPAHTYTYGIKFKLASFIKIGRPGALYVLPILAESRIVTSVALSRREVTDVDFTCFSAEYEDDLTFFFPKNSTVLAIPDPFEVSGSLQTYKSSYKLEGNKFTAVRTLYDVTTGPTCTKDDAKKYKDIADKAWSDLKAQLVYK